MLRSAAILTIKNADTMSPEGRKAIADWLRGQAKDLVKLGHKYHKTLRARYLCDIQGE